MVLRLIVNFFKEREYTTKHDLEIVKYDIINKFEERYIDKERERGIGKGSRAFSDCNVDYYRLNYDLEHVKRGSIFYHDKKDSIRGSLMEGCLKLCWTPDGNCYGGLCADTVVFHVNFRESNMFSKVSK
ncbi:hypothetical protein [Clostridium sp.]|uniref:hypothetical protein n=1 Tax=Clostridium sp. TaxID=1506 RepID=UPI003217600B